MPSTVPAAIAALVRLAQTTLPRVDVHDGPPVGGNTADYVCIGHGGGGDIEAVTGSTPFVTLGAQRREESYEVVCVAVSTSGDLPMAARREAAYALVDAFSTALASDYTLAGLVRIASVTSDFTLLQEQTTEGATAGVRFSVSIAARI